MQYISINSIGDYPEDFLIAKVDVERHLIETEAIEKRMKLEEFIIYLNIQNTIYMKGQKSIAFSIQQGQSDKYVFYSLLDQDENGELFESFKKKLEHLKYNFSSLNKIDNMDLLNMDLTKEELFMFNFVIHK